MENLLKNEIQILNDYVLVIFFRNIISRWIC